jgi:hypothetical protein
MHTFQYRGRSSPPENNLPGIIHDDTRAIGGPGHTIWTKGGIGNPGLGSDGVKKKAAIGGSESWAILAIRVHAGAL